MAQDTDATERTILPNVTRPRAGASGVAIAAGFGMLAVVLFVALDTHRRALEAPAVAAPFRDGIAGSSPLPPLIIPSPVAPPSAPPPAPTPALAAPPPTRPHPALVPPVVRPAPFVPSPPLVRGEPANAVIRPAFGNPAVFDNGAPPVALARGSGQQPATTRDVGDASARAYAGRMADKGMTVAQGVVIPAVLESAINSSGAGFVRALVQTDIHGFDGTRVLIPRGSRLIGEYDGRTAQGQSRVLINWVRLIRPDGATIALASPATDPVGANGVRAHVNSHFFARFSGAILQSLLTLGVNLAARSANNSVVVALPGAVPPATTLTNPVQAIPPTLSVRAGTSVSVFVARDLDFSDVEDGS